MANKRNVLIVDSNKENRKRLCEILNHEYRVIEALDGREALDILYDISKNIDVVLLDIAKPVKENYAVLEQIHNDEKLSRIPVIVTTENNTENIEEEALSLGAIDFVAKPYKPSIIKHRIANTIRLGETAVLVNAAEKDALTGALSKEFFYNHVEQTLKEEEDEQFDIVCADIERFKLVNDLFGTKVGDEFLKCVASAIVKKIGSTQVCGRIGGDKFGFLIHHNEYSEKDFFEELIKETSRFPISINVCISFGIYTIESRDMPAEAMCDRALLACNSIKRKYGVHYAFYNEELRRSLLSEQMIIDSMKTALEEHQFEVYYQPKYDIYEEKVAGAEALVRWIHPEKGFMSPGEFIPIFEQNGFITELDTYVWDIACQTLREWISRGKEVVPISVNVSRNDIYNPQLPQILSDLIKKYKLEAKYLHLEITETAYTENPKQLIEAIEKLKLLGFVIEMDDFGSGYSSLNMLSELPIDILKLDMKFIQNESQKSNSKSILSFIISLAKWLNLPVVAEGVETKKQIETLRSMECEYVQGYYYAKPMNQAAFEEHMWKDDNYSLVSTNLNTNPTIKQVMAAKRKTDKVMVIVDSVKENRRNLAKIFAKLYTIIEADNGADAFEYIKGNISSIDIILVELIMPVMDGFELLKALKSDVSLRSIPVVVTSQRCEDSEAKALSMGAADFISKPYNTEVALNRVKNVMAQGKLEVLQEQNDLLQRIHSMEKKAKTDGLTGLLNRTEFEAQGTNFFNCKKENQEATFVILDIDNFKLVNDQLGHAKGDEAICKVAEILKTCFREHDLICRLGGDEFAIFVRKKFNKADIDQRMEKLCNKLKFVIDTMQITCSIGVCTSPEYGKDYQTLYQNADVALLTAKRLGKNQYQIFGGEVELPSHVLFRNMDWLMDEASDAVIVCDAQSYELLYLNDVACKMVEKAKKECMGKKCYEVLWNRSSVCKHCVHIERLSKDYCEHEVHPEGTDKNYIVKGKLVDWGGKQARIQYIQDNTNKALMAKKMEEISKDRKRLLDLMPGGFFRYYAKNDQLDFINENMFKMLGYTQEEFTEKFKNKFSNLVWHEDLERVIGEINSQIALGNVDQCDYRIEKADGTFCWVHDIGHLVKEADGTEYFYVTIIDITQSHEMQERLIESRQKLEIALEHANMMYWEHNLLTDTAISDGRSNSIGFPNVIPNYSHFLIEQGVIPKEYISLYQKKQQEIYDGALYVTYDIPLTIYGKQSWWHIHCTNLFDDIGNPIKTIGTAEIIKDLNKEKNYCTDNQ